jgi:hypothetical protein
MVRATGVEAGEDVQASTAELPAATAATIPPFTAAVTAAFTALEKPPPKLRLITAVLPGVLADKA